MCGILHVDCVYWIICVGFYVWVLYMFSVFQIICVGCMFAIICVESSVWDHSMSAFIWKDKNSEERGVPFLMLPPGLPDCVAWDSMPGGDLSLWVQEHTLCMNEHWLKAWIPGYTAPWCSFSSSFSLGLDLPSRFLLHLELSIPQLVPVPFPWEGQLHMSLHRPLEPKTPLRVPGHKTPPH